MFKKINSFLNKHEKFFVGAIFALTIWGFTVLMMI